MQAQGLYGITFMTVKLPENIIFGLPFINLPNSQDKKLNFRFESRYTP